MTRSPAAYTLLLLLATMLPVALCLPLGPYAAARLVPDQPQNLPPGATIKLGTTPTTLSAVAEWNPPRVHVNTGNGQFGLPHVPSGPWTTAWDIWESAAEELHLKKRAFNVSAQESIAQHLRPKDWVQRLKDFWRRITFRKLKVVKSQADQVKKKYRSPSYQYGAFRTGTKPARSRPVVDPYRTKPAPFDA